MPDVIELIDDLDEKVGNSADFTAMECDFIRGLIRYMRSEVVLICEGKKLNGTALPSVSRSVKSLVETHSVAALPISRAAFNEISELLLQAGYDGRMHTVDTGNLIDMSGLGIVERSERQA